MLADARRYRAFEDDLLSRDEWEALKRQKEIRLAIIDDPDTCLTETQATISELLDQLPTVSTELTSDFVSPESRRQPPTMVARRISNNTVIK